MNSYTTKAQKNQSQSMANEDSKKSNTQEPAFQLMNNGPEAITQRKLQEVANNSLQAKKIAQLKVLANSDLPQTQLAVQKKENNTGLPDNLKTGIENLSGHSLDDVNVHYNSNKPTQLQAHAYAQGTDIHLGAGQEKHLPHEAWHVVQQKQGRVSPTTQLMGNVNINDDTGLEKEADVMGAKAIQMQAKENTRSLRDMGNLPSLGVAQCMMQVGKKNIKRTVLEAAINKGIKQSIIPEMYIKKVRGIESLNDDSEEAIDKLMEVYSSSKLHLTDFTSLIHQASQDLHMVAGGTPELVGVGHQNSEFTYKRKLNDRDARDLTFKSGMAVKDDQRVYRTMTSKDWGNNHISGHGGSIGQAMHYFNLGKAAHAGKPDRKPDFLVEFTFSGKKLSALLSGIDVGGEGENSTDDTLGGKTEDNTAFGMKGDIFSVDLKNASGLLNKDFVTARVLASTNGALPEKTRKGENDEWQKRPDE